MHMIDPKWMPTLLKAYGFPESPFLNKEKSNIKNEEKTENTYWYPFARLTVKKLQKDTLNYALHYPHNVGERHVCFFVAKKPYPGIVLLLYFLPWNKECIKSLKTSHRETRIKIIRVLYPRVDAFILGDLNRAEPKMLELVPLIKQAYGKVNIHMKPLGALNPDLVLATHLYHYLHQGHLESGLDIQALYKQHHEQCQKTLLQRLENYREHSSMGYRHLRTSLQVLVKFQLLLSTHTDITNLSKANSLEKLDELQMLNCYQKKRIYGENLTFKKAVSILSLNSLLTLLGSTDIESMGNQLKEWRETGLKQVTQWERVLIERRKVLKSSWFSYFYYLGRYGPKTFYRYSLIGFGAEISGMLIKAILDALQNTRAVQTTACLPSCLQFSLEQMYLYTKWVGGLLGAIGIWASGWYGLLRMLLVSEIGTQLASIFDKIAIDDQKAQVSNILPGSVVSIALVSLIFACFEAYLSGETPVLIYTLSAFIGSISLTEFGKRWVLELQTSLMHPMTESQALILVSLALLGQQLGGFVARCGYHAFDKYSTRQELTKAFCEIIEAHNMTGCVAEYPEGYHQWSFWSRSKDTVRLGWTWNQRFFESSCEVTKPTPQSRVVNCDAPREYDYLPLRAYNMGPSHPKLY